MPKLTAELIESTAGIYLSRKYDQLKPTPEFHRECWQRYCGDSLACATAAPRGHAKSTALTHDYIIASVAWRVDNYVIIIGASEEKAIEHLQDIADEFRENEDIIRDFKIKGFLQDTKADIIVECQDGYQFRILARGAEQKIRGTKWRGARPSLIVGDDLEDDEQVENKERRKKFRKWFFRAAKMALRRGGRIRVHGTILHKDSLLNHLIHNSTWNSKCYKAHKSFSDFSEILWPEQFPESALRAIRQEFIDEGDSAGYSQEMLNDPRDDEKAYLLVEWFLPMPAEARDAWHKIGVGCDFAVSKKDAANRTSFTIGGKTIDNFIDILDVRVDRWDTKEWIDEMFSIHSRWNPEYWFVEDGVIWKAVWPTIREEMRDRDVWLNFVELQSITDKASRGRPMQKRMKAGGMRFDKETSWYEEHQEELLDFSATAEADLDDQFDSDVELVRGFDEIVIEDEDQQTDEEVAWEREVALQRQNDGRSETTGY